MLELRDINVCFGTHQVLRNFSAIVSPGDCIVIVGPNGAGKSTLFDIISGKITAGDGTIVLDNTNITATSERHRCSMITRLFQDVHRNAVGHFTVAENLAFARYSRRRVRLRDAMADMSRADAAQIIQQLGMDPSILDRSMNRLSGGQQQLVAFAMATQLPPKLLLLDEVTAALDPAAATNLLIHAAHFIKQYSVTTLIITHDPHIALSIGNKIWVMEYGRIAKYYGPEERKTLAPKKLIGQIDYQKVARCYDDETTSPT